MNIIQVKIDFEQGTCQKQGISVITGDYNSTKVVFEFNESATGTKIFEMKDPNDNLVYADEIVDNEVVLVGYEEEEGETTTYSLFGEEGDYTFEVSLYQDDGRLTSVCDYITANKEQVIVDGEEVQERITLFDNLMNELNRAIVETNNLDLDAEKVEHTTTVVLTKKDGTQKTIEILDGEKGDKGDKGDAGAIKMQIVNVLPPTGQDDTIYLVPLEEPETQENRYAEYVWINNQWELLGKIGIQVDLTDYYTKQETNTLLSGKLDTSKVVNANSTTAGETYDVRYINTMIGDIETILTTLDVGSGV